MMRYVSLDGVLCVFKLAHGYAGQAHAVVELRGSLSRNGFPPRGQWSCAYAYRVVDISNNNHESCQLVFHIQASKVLPLLRT